ncbi:hypothetical protein G7046_g5130 [Stylonectria norvegica]|nr:hypothetical protein G7046_g5130 [Stylonectria norvegica]
MTSLRAVPFEDVHKTSYPAISTSRLELSQAGKTVLITGAGYGIGYNIANSFAAANSSNIVLTGRRESILQDAAKHLLRDHEKSNPKLKVHVHTVDVTDSESVATLWAWLVDQGLVVDVLVLNAGRQSPFKSLLELGLKEVWEFYKVNVHGHMDFAEHFYKHERPDSKGPKILINVSTAGSWDTVSCAPVPVYSLTKNSGTMLLQQIADSVPADTLYIVNFHPGLVRTLATQDIFPDGYFPNGVPWDSDDLGGNFAVWLASPDAAFLHGRFVHAAWDVDELKSGVARAKIDNDPHLLKVGVLGFHP